MRVLRFLQNGVSLSAESATFMDDETGLLKQIHTKTDGGEQHQFTSSVHGSDPSKDTTRQFFGV
jgi:hypothetical protein